MYSTNIYILIDFMEGPQVNVYVDEGNSAIPGGENELGNEAASESNLGDFLLNRVTPSIVGDGIDEENSVVGINDAG